MITEDGKVVGWNVRNAGLDREMSGLNHVRPIEAARPCVEAARGRWEDL